VDPADQSATSTPGARLAAERERQGLSRADIAQRLHMSAYQIEAIESGDYERLPRGTFLRGFVRNYAKVLGLDGEAMVAALSVDAPERSRPGIVVASQNIRFDPLGQRLSSPYVKAAGIATVVVSIAFAAMYWWLFVRPAPPATAAKKAVVVAEAPATPANAEVEPLPPPVDAPRMPEPAPAKPAPEPKKADAKKAEPVAAAKPAPAPAPVVTQAMAANAASQSNIDAAPVIAAGGSVIRFKFRGSAWVEIKDGRGKVLLSRNNPGGSEAEVIGKGPFSVVVGNAPEVTMFFNDREFDLEPHTRVAVARFTVP
jgi:cytoskeleton protein RodZ